MKTLTTSIVLSLTLLLCACEVERRGTFSGTYTTGFEASDFSPEGSDEYWWVTPIDNSLEELNKDYRLKLDESGANYPIPIRYKVTFTGMVSTKGNFGHLGGYVREFKVENLESFERLEENRNIEEPNQAAHTTPAIAPR